MMRLENPELLRYIRSELRPSRVAIIMGGTLGIALLVALFISSIFGEHVADFTRYWRVVYAILFTVTSAILVLWSVLNCSQAIVGERTQRTFDFWRTTRLTPAVLALGKLVGAPIGAWLQFATALPVLLITGFLAGYHITTIVGSLLVIAVFNLAVSSLALCVSMRAQDSRRSTVMMIVLLLVLLPSFVRVDFGGSVIGSAWGALNPSSGIAAWHDGIIATVSLFGRHISSLLVTVILSLIVLSWCLAALVRSVKLEPDQRSLFSPVQVVGVSATILLFVYAAFRPVTEIFGSRPPFSAEQAASLSLNTLLGSGLSAAEFCLYFTVIATLLTRDNLRQELRRLRPSQIVWRLISPWLATGALALVAVALALTGYAHSFGGAPLHWSGVVGLYLALTAYAVRDGMLLQWMVSQRVKAPILKGLLLLVCYYVASFAISALIAGPQHAPLMLRWLVPFAGNPTAPQEQPLWLIIAVLVPPIATTALLAMGILRKMQRTAAPVVSPARA